MSAFPTFRTTKQGEKVVFGTVRQVHPGNVKVSVEGARGGLERVKVLSLGKPFTVNGVEHVYGYLREAAAAPAKRPAKKASAGRRGTCDECFEYRDLVPARDSSGINGMVCRRCAALAPHGLSFA